MSPLIESSVAVAALALWLWPLLRMRSRNRGREVATIDRRARWGVILEVVGYSVIWQSDFWDRTPAPWQWTLAILLLIAGVAVSWQAANALGSQLRIDASLSTDHKLTRSGPYRWVRHPVYASFLCVLLGTGLLIATPLLLASGVAIFICGTEIRVRIEDALLAARFGEEFAEYRRTVPAYLPGVR